MNSGSVTERVRANAEAKGSGRIFLQSRGVSSDDLVDTEACQRTAGLGDEDWASWRRGWRAHVQEESERFGRFVPQGTRAPLASLSVEPNSGIGAEFQVRHAHVSYFLGSRSGVVQEEQKCPVSSRMAMARGEAMEQGLDVFPFEEMRFRRRRSLHRDRRHLLAYGQHLRRPLCHVLEERVKNSQPVIPGPHVIASLLLQISQEALNVWEGQIGETETSDLAPDPLSDVAKEQLQNIPVALDRAGPKSLLDSQVVHEERMDNLCQVLSSQSASPLMAGRTNCSKRRLASRSSSSVMVK